MMEKSIKLIAICFALGALSACVPVVREGPPAPVVQVTPRPAPPARRVEPTPEPVVDEAPRPVAKPTPKKTAKPAKRTTKVYAYQDPSRAPDPEPVTPAEPPKEPAALPGEPGYAASSPSGSPPPKAGDQTKAADRPPSENAGAPQPGDEQQIAKAETRLETPAAPPPPPVSALPESNVSAPELAPAADALASQAERQRQAGDYSGAAASLERSLRISPRESYLWNRLARVRMEQGQSVQAGNLAARSNDLAGDNADVEKDNWRIIAEAKRRSGDVAGAAEAEQRAGRD